MIFHTVLHRYQTCARSERGNWVRVVKHLKYASNVFFFFFNSSCAGWRSHEVIRSDFKGLLQTLKHHLHLFILVLPIFIASFTLYSYIYRVIQEQMTSWHDNRKRKDSLCFQPISAGGISILVRLPRKCRANMAEHWQSLVNV